MNTIKLLILGFVLLSIACTKKTEWQTDSTGLKYIIEDSHPENKQIKEGDVIEIKLRYTNQRDSLMFDSREIHGPFRIPVRKSVYKGDIQRAMSLLHVGDSARFLLNASDFYARTRQEALPKGVRTDEKLQFYIRVINIVSSTEIEQESQLLDQSKTDEEKMALANYISQNQIKEQATESGLYFIGVREGRGRTPQKGNTLKVRYKGYFLDGTVFDSSEKRNRPVEFIIGGGEVIKGWEEGLMRMKKGAIARLIIPSGLAYGGKGVPPLIPPYTTLIFEIELLDIR